MESSSVARWALALAAHRKATLVLAHAGEGPPARNPNLVVDLSGMHFQRKPALASETGPLDLTWKALIAPSVAERVAYRNAVALFRVE